MARTISETTLRRRAAKKGLYVKRLRGGRGYALIEQRTRTLILGRRGRLDVSLDEAARLVEAHRG